MFEVHTFYNTFYYGTFVFSTILFISDEFKTSYMNAGNNKQCYFCKNQKKRKFLILKSTLQIKYKKTQIDYIDNIVYFFITFHSFLTSKQL